MSCRKVGKILRTETLSVKYNLMQLCHDYRNKHDCPPVGGTQPIFGYSWAAEDLKTWPCSGQKIPKKHTLFRTTPSVLLPWSWLGQRTKRNPRAINWSCRVCHIAVKTTPRRRWYSGEHSCLPSSWPGFDSRPTHFFFYIIFHFYAFISLDKILQ